MACAARAAHALVDEEPHALNDPVGQQLCHVAQPPALSHQLAQPDTSLLAAARLCAISRSVFAERQLDTSGITQYVVLGAGLDTSAHRLRSDRHARTWLVDRPGVLSWRTSLYALADLDDAGTSVPCDLGRDDLIEALRRAGLDLDQPVFLSWLGVSMYLTPQEASDTLTSLRRLGSGSQLVLDYIQPAGLRDENGAAYAQSVAHAVGASGEPWRWTLTPQALTGLLSSLGWSTTGDIRDDQALGPAFWPRTDALQPMSLVRLRHATLTSPSAPPTTS